MIFNTKTLVHKNALLRNWYWFQIQLRFISTFVSFFDILAVILSNTLHLKIIMNWLIIIIIKYLTLFSYNMPLQMAEYRLKSNELQNVYLQQWYWTIRFKYIFFSVRNLWHAITINYSNVFSTYKIKITDILNSSKIKPKIRYMSHHKRKILLRNFKAFQNTTRRDK